MFATDIWPTSGSKVVFAFNGSSGSGKSSAVDYLSSAFGVPVVPKFVDRPARRRRGIGEPSCVAHEVFDRFSVQAGFCSYPYGGYRYGFFGRDVVRLLDTAGAASIILGVNAPILALRDIVSATSVVVPVFISVADEGVILGRLRSAEYSEDEVHARVWRSEQNIAAYHAMPDLYEHVIDNSLDWMHFAGQLSRLARSYGLRPRAAVAA